MAITKSLDIGAVASATSVSVKQKTKITPQIYVPKKLS